jgi:hypothetical protein
MQRTILSIILVATVLICTGTALADSAISYQGRLDAGGQAFDGSVDMVFELFDAETNGSAIGSPVAINGVPVQQGLFQVDLDFGAQAWELGRWLQITVDGQLLSPRQRVTAAPLAARAAGVAEEAVGSQELEDGGVQAVDIADNSIFSNHIVDGAIEAADLAVGSVNSDAIADASVAPVDLSQGLYRTKTDLYVVEASTTLTTGSTSVEAACADANDLPITWECDLGSAGGALRLKGIRHTNWGTVSGVAATRCAAEYGTGVGTESITTRIYCIDVP